MPGSYERRLNRYARRQADISSFRRLKKGESFSAIAASLRRNGAAFRAQISKRISRLQLILPGGVFDKVEIFRMLFTVELSCAASVD
jgi:hypothetical protein